ncbi:MAG: peptidoglycan DD-metalloendopeptidase family protein [Vescimonas sp.]
MEFMKQHRRALYIALALCVVAAGVTGYLVWNREAPTQQASSNQPVVDVKPSVVTPVKPTLPTPEEKVEEEAPPVSAVTELLPQVISPLDGTTVTVFSMSELLYDETMADWRTHEGLDIQAAEGDAVKTAAAGEVISVTRDELMGTTVCIAHSGGYVTKYSSLQDNPPISQGQKLSAGDIVGYVGTAAAEASMGPHLHFAVEKDGTLIDPQEYIK